MQHDINPGNVKWIVANLNNAVGSGQFTTGEVILGLAEFTGSLITAIAPHPVSGLQCAEVLMDHLKVALRTGYAAKGFNMGEESH